MDLILTQSWNEYLNKFESSKKDVYFSEEYVRLYETGNKKALCVVCGDNEKVLLLPFLREEKDGYYDFETAYGYGGIISNTDDKAWTDKAIEEISSFLKREKYICGFIRFHSLLDNYRLCKEHFQVIFDRNTVAIDTKMGVDDIWSTQIISKNRNMIRKAEKNGLEYKAEYDFASINEFIDLYNSTMERLDADEFYFFDRNYYDDFIRKFKEKAFLGTVRKDSRLICAAIFFYSKEYGHYHLEGSDHSYSSLGANNFLLWKTAVEFNKLGVKEFHLGGGYNSEPDNSLLKFKKAFSSNLKDFYIGKWIFNSEKYDEIKQKWMMENPDKIEKYGKLLLCYKY